MPPSARRVWSTRAGRVEAFGRWSLNWEPGSTYEYHATSAHWVLAEIIDRVTGGDYRDVVQERVTDPAGLPRVLGLEPGAGPGGDRHRSSRSASRPRTEEIKATFGVDSLPVTEVTPEALLAFNDPDVRAVGVPGGGAAMRASDLALFYQALLHNPGETWKPDVLADATGHVRNRLPERWTGVPANRSLGLLLAGDDGFSNVRGLGRTVSPGRVRPQRRRRTAGLGRPGHRPVVRLLHQRHRPARGARAPPRDRAQQPRGRLRLELTCSS